MYLIYYIHPILYYSVRRGASLYEQVHINREKMGLHTRVHIVRQIAQGMGYLHAKGIVMDKLNTKNVYLEPKVKLCLMDYGMSEKKYERYVKKHGGCRLCMFLHESCFGVPF